MRIFKYAEEGEIVSDAFIVYKSYSREGVEYFKSIRFNLPLPIFVWNKYCYRWDDEVRNDLRYLLVSLRITLLSRGNQEYFLQTHFVPLKGCFS